jgi:hypothetical protein
LRSIALVGLAGVGKDTLAQHIENTHRHRVLSFAEPLKRIVQQIYGFSDAQLFGPSRLRNEPDKRFPREDGTFLCPREALERFGTEAGRKCYGGTWLDLAMRQAADAEANCEPWVFTDCRFKNEMDACCFRGGKLVRLVRTGQIPCDHASEQEQFALPDDYFDLVLSTDGSIEDTRSAFDEWFSKL